MSTIRRIRALVQNGLYYLTEHAYEEAAEDGLDIFDVEYAMLAGKMRRTWPREGRYEIAGSALDGRRVGVSHHRTGKGSGDYRLRGQTTSMRKRATPSAFWEGERCEYCNGPLREKKSELSRRVKGKRVLIENVPAGVCTQCGTRYYSANVLKTIEETLAGRRKAKREVRVPVYSL